MGVKKLINNNIKIFGTVVILILTSIGSIIVTADGEENNIFKAENIDDYTIEININSPSFKLDIVEFEGESFTILDIIDEGHIINIGEAKLPVIKRMIEIPQGAKPVIKIESVSWDFVSLNNLNLPTWIVPVQPSDLKFLDKSGDFIIDLAYYNKNKFSPHEIVKISEIGEIRGRRFALIEVTPVQYNPATGELKTMKYCNILIYLHNCNLEETNEKIIRYASKSYEDLFETMFENYGYYEKDLLINFRDQEGFLIIVYDSFEDEIQQLTILKEGKGFDLTVTKTSDIPGGVTKENIFNYIVDAYDNWNIPPSYVLLVGDTPQIPTFTGTSSNSEADLYYVTVDGSDYLPDIHIGRFPGSQEAHIEAMVDKSVYYEQGIFENNDWIKKGAFIASSDNGKLAEETHNYVIENYLDPSGYVCDKIYEASGGNTQDIENSLNDGRSLCVYSGHGYSGGWGCVPWDQEDVSGLENNGMYPFVTSHACSTNPFGMPECFGETWLREPEKAAIGFWGASASTYWDEDDILEKKMFSAWWDDGLETIGGMTDMALYYLYQYYSGGGLTKYYFEAYNVLGDPSLSIWSDNPSEPPEKPLKPSGLDKGVPLEEFEFSTSTTDPEGDQVYYMWDWGNDNYSDWLGPYTSGQTSLASHIWNELGDYEIRVKAKDNYNAESEWSEPHTISIVENQPPDKVTTDGPKWGFGGVEYEFIFTSTDLEEHDIYYRVNWDDDTITDWLGPFSSGVTIKLNHSWKTKGSYWIKGWVKDLYGGISGQASFRINILTNANKEKSRNPLFLRFLERFLVVERLLSLIRVI